MIKCLGENKTKDTGGSDKTKTIHRKLTQTNKNPKLEEDLQITSPFSIARRTVQKAMYKNS